MNILKLVSLLVAISSNKVVAKDLGFYAGESLPFYGIGLAQTEYEFVFPSLFNDDQESCIQVDDGKLNFGGSRSGHLSQNLSKSYSYRWISAALDAKMKARLSLAGYDLASAKLETKFRAANITTNATYVTGLEYQLQKGTLYLTQINLSDNAKTMLTSINSSHQKLQKLSGDEYQIELKNYKHLSKKFYLKCGDYFVHQAVLGASFQSAIRYNFIDTRNMLEFLVKAEAKILREKVKKRYSDEHDFHLSNTIIEIDNFQQGGDPEEYENFRIKMGGESSDARGPLRSRCFTEPYDFGSLDEFRRLTKHQLERCYKSWDLTHEYFSEKFYHQIMEPKWKSSEKRNLVSLNHHKMSYLQAGFLNSPLLLPQKFEEKLKALNKIFQEIAKIRMVILNLEHTINRHTKAITINGEWQLQIGKNSNLLHGARELFNDLKASMKSCIQKMKEDNNIQQCEVNDIDYKKFEKFFEI